MLIYRFGVKLYLSNRLEWNLFYKMVELINLKLLYLILLPIFKSVWELLPNKGKLSKIVILLMLNKIFKLKTIII